MPNDEIFEFINKLKNFEEKISGPDMVDETFINELNSTLSQLTNDVKLDNTFLNVNIKKIMPNATIPSYSKDADAGMDLTATDIIEETPYQITYGTDIAMEIPKGYVGLIFPRSSIRNYHLWLSNSVGVIDSGYRGEIKIVFNKYQIDKPLKYNVGDRVAQILIIPHPLIKFTEVSELSNTERGDGGYGSTGI